jgi:hypothetical protein
MYYLTHRPWFHAYTCFVSYFIIIREKQKISTISDTTTSKELKLMIFFALTSKVHVRHRHESEIYMKLLFLK